MEGPGASPPRPLVRPALRELGLIAAAALAYFGVRNLTAGDAATAFANARLLERTEASLGVALEHALHGRVVSHDALVTLANWVYIWGHWPVIITVGVLLYRHRRAAYRRLRNAMFVSGGIGFLFFALFPVAPPRLADRGLTDTVTLHSEAYRALQPPGLTNQFAAFPSLHFGWNVLVGIVVFGATTHLLLRLLALASPLAMGLAVVATANHYVLDIAGGLVVVLVGLAVAILWFERPTATLARWPSSSPTGPATTSRASGWPRLQRSGWSRPTSASGAVASRFVTSRPWGRSHSSGTAGSSRAPSGPG